MEVGLESETWGEIHQGEEVAGKVAREEVVGMTLVAQWEEPSQTAGLNLLLSEQGESQKVHMGVEDKS